MPISHSNDRSKMRAQHDASKGERAVIFSHGGIMDPRVGGAISRAFKLLTSPSPGRQGRPPCQIQPYDNAPLPCPSDGILTRSIGSE